MNPEEITDPEVSGQHDSSPETLSSSTDKPSQRPFRWNLLIVAVMAAIGFYLIVSSDGSENFPGRISAATTIFIIIVFAVAIVFGTVHSRTNKEEHGSPSAKDIDKEKHAEKPVEKKKNEKTKSPPKPRFQQIAVALILILLFTLNYQVKGAYLKLHAAQRKTILYDFSEENPPSIIISHLTDVDASREYVLPKIKAWENIQVVDQDHALGSWIEIICPGKTLGEKINGIDDPNNLAITKAISECPDQFQIDGTGAIAIAPYQ